MVTQPADGALACVCGAPANGPTCAVCGGATNGAGVRRKMVPFTAVPAVTAALCLGIIAVTFATVPAPATASAPTQIAPVAPAADVADPHDLLIDQVPGLTEFVPYPEHTDGLDLEETAQLDEESADQQRVTLRERGFRRGAIRWWAKEEERVTYVAVSEFADAQAPAQFMADISWAFAADGGVQPVGLSAPGAVGYGYSLPEDNIYGYEVSFAKGPRLYRIVMVNLDGRPGGEDVLTQITAEQYERG